MVHNRGFIHLTPLIIVCVLAGAWYLHKSYKENRLQENIGAMLRDYRAAITATISNEEDKKKVEAAMDVIEEIVLKQAADVVKNEKFQEVGKELTNSFTLDSVQKAWDNLVTKKTGD